MGSFTSTYPDSCFRLVYMSTCFDIGSNIAAGFHYDGQKSSRTHSRRGGADGLCLTEAEDQSGAVARKYHERAGFDVRLLVEITAGICRLYGMFLLSPVGKGKQVQRETCVYPNFAATGPPVRHRLHPIVFNAQLRCSHVPSTSKALWRWPERPSFSCKSRVSRRTWQ